MFKSLRTNIGLMRELFLDLFRSRPLHVLLTLFLMLFRSMSAGVGLLLILPLLQVIGLVKGHDAVGGFSKKLLEIFTQVHLPITLLSILIVYVIVVSFIALAAFAEQIISTRLQQQYTHHLRATLYRQLLHAQWPFFLKRKTSDLLHSLTAQVQSIAVSNFQLVMLLNHITLVCVYAVLAFLLSWQMTLVAVMCALLLLSLMLPLHQLTSKSGRDHLQQNQTIFQSISEQLSALKTIKSSGFEATFVDETLKVSLSLEDQNQRLTRMMAATKLLYTLGSVVTFSLLLYAAIAVFAVPIGSLLLLLVVFARLLPMVSSIQQGYQRLLHQLPAYSDVKQLSRDCVANQENLQVSMPLSFHDAIIIKNLSFSYRPGNALPIIQNVTLSIKKNTTTAFMGPSGVGKSTLADLIIGLLEPTMGTIFIDRNRLDHTNKLAWRKSVAYVNQDVFLFNASIRDNVQLFCKEQADAALWDALHLAAAADFVAELEQGLDTIIGDRGVRLSGGESQRIALTRALLAKPELLILDESTSSLDTMNIIKIQQALRHLRGKMTILIISHQTEMSDFADQKIVLTKKGMIDVSKHTYSPIGQTDRSIGFSDMESN